MQGQPVDFDGSFTLSWQAEGHEHGFEVERSNDNGQAWNVIATPTGTSLALTDQPNGNLQYRVRGLQEGVIGSYRHTRQQREERGGGPAVKG